MVYATREEVERALRARRPVVARRRKPEEEREPGTPLVYVTYRALPQTPTADG
jgi:hypothetical protein